MIKDTHDRLGKIITIKRLMQEQIKKIYKLGKTPDKFQNEYMTND